MGECILARRSSGGGDKNTFISNPATTAGSLNCGYRAQNSYSTSNLGVGNTEGRTEKLSAGNDANYIGYGSSFGSNGYDVYYIDVLIKCSSWCIKARVYANKPLEIEISSGYTVTLSLYLNGSNYWEISHYYHNGTTATVKYPTQILNYCWVGTTTYVG